MNDTDAVLENRINLAIEALKKARPSHMEERDRARAADDGFGVTVCCYSHTRDMEVALKGDERALAYAVEWMRYPSIAHTVTVTMPSPESLGLARTDVER